MRYLAIPALALCTISLFGCGPMTTGPMPPRLVANSQKQVDEGWEKALTPVNHLDRQTMLDALILTQAFQVGVDRLSFRSEKAYSGGLVVMEIQFERSAPANDRFEVKMLDKTGVEKRKITYKRDEVESVFRDFFDKDPANNADPQLTPEQRVTKEAEIQKRVQQVQKLWTNVERPNR